MWDSRWHEHLDAVHRFAVRLTGDRQRAEDVAQETMLRGWKSRNSVREPHQMRIWLLRIAANVWRDQLRRQRVRIAPEPMVEEPAVEIDDAVERTEFHGMMLRALDQLPDRQRQALHLSAVEGLSNTAIADVLGVSVDAVKASVYLARKAMRAWLESQDQFKAGMKLDRR